MKIYITIFLTLMGAMALGQVSNEKENDDQCNLNCVGSYQNAAQECASSNNPNIAEQIQAVGAVDNNNAQDLESRKRAQQTQEIARQTGLRVVLTACLKASSCCQKECSEESQNNKAVYIKKDLKTCGTYTKSLS